jgi:hypothetical protein
MGWNAKHFHEHIREQHGFRWGYTWTKTQLHTASLVERLRGVTHGAGSAVIALEPQTSF